jgi:HK97 gp10 family phage protein
MPGEVTLRITGAKELEASLRSFGSSFASRLGNKALKAGAQPIVEEAKRLVPVRTGALRDSITAVVSRDHEQAQRKVKVGFKYPAARRAHFTEFGTRYQPAQPFLRPALDTEAQTAIDEITRVLEDGLDTEVLAAARASISLSNWLTGLAGMTGAFDEEFE